MSISSWLTVNVSSHLDAFSLFMALSKVGWNPVFKGEISILPIADGDRFAWKSMPADELDLAISEMREKGASGEVIGVVMTYGDSERGCDFLFNPGGTIDISTAVNRKIMDGPVRATAIEWYVGVIHLTFAEIGVTITSIAWSETY